MVKVFKFEAASVTATVFPLYEYFVVLVSGSVTLNVRPSTSYAYVVHCCVFAVRYGCDTC